MPPGPVIVFARTSHSANHPLHSIYILWVCESLICCCRRKRLIWWDTVSLPIYAHVCMTAFCWTHASQHLQHVTHSKHDYRDCILKPGPTWRWATGRPLEDLSLWTLGWQWSIFKTLNQGITWVSTLRNWLVLRKGVLIYLILTYLNIEMRGREMCVCLVFFFDYRSFFPYMLPKPRNMFWTSLRLRVEARANASCCWIWICPNSLDLLIWGRWYLRTKGNPYAIACTWFL